MPVDDKAYKYLLRQYCRLAIGKVFESLCYDYKSLRFLLYSPEYGRLVPLILDLIF